MMNRLIVTAAGVLSLMTGSVYAGCNYDSHVAADESQMPVVAAAEATDPLLLAKVKEHEETEALERLLETPPFPN